jgi:hypothetical protein
MNAPQLLAQPVRMNMIELCEDALGVLERSASLSVGNTDARRGSMKNYELVHAGDQWKFRAQGADRAIKAFDSKQEGKDFSTGYMRDHGGSLKIKKLDGTIQEERTYPRDDDPRKSPG